jgi:multiple antibiotic resistance protein
MKLFNYQGGYILRLFGLSIPIIQLGGEIMICKMGWDILSGQQQSEEEKIKLSEVTPVIPQSKTSYFTRLLSLSVPVTASAPEAGVGFVRSSDQLIGHLGYDFEDMDLELHF